jgi:hypothetical protein
VTCEVRTILKKEFEHDEELSLIWEGNSEKMLLIRFLSIQNRFQMKLTKGNENMRTLMSKECQHHEE